MADLTDAKRRLVERLKRVESATAPELAAEFGLTDTAVRQHLDALELAGLVVRHVGPPNGRGRPPVHWRLTPKSSELFPDHHGELAVAMIEAIRSTLGDDALERVLAARAHRQLGEYRRVIDTTKPVADRVRRLAELRNAEGYLAEAEADPEHRGAVLLTEHHCPINEAAGSCAGLCRSELELFRSSLGADVTVERTQHILGGDARCAYRISARSPA